MTATWVGASAPLVSRNIFQTMLEKPGDRADRQAVGLAGQGRQRVVGAEDEARAVDQVQVAAGSEGAQWSASADPGFRTKRRSQ